jgi:glycerol dehydrogenase-like iron-containing ADH family enzyme
MVLEDSVDLLRSEKFEQVASQLSALHEKCKSMSKPELKRTATQTVKALNAIVAFGGTVGGASNSAQALSIAHTAISTLELFQPVLVSKASDFVKLHFNLCVKSIEAKQVSEF